MDFKTSNSDLFFQTQTKKEDLRNKFLENLPMSKSSQPPRDKNTALNHIMRQEGLYILVTHSQNQEPGRSLDKSHVDITHTFFHLSSPIHQDCIKYTPPRLSKLCVWAE